MTSARMASIFAWIGAFCQAAASWRSRRSASGTTAARRALSCRRSPALARVASRSMATVAARALLKGMDLSVIVDLLTLLPSGPARGGHHSPPKPTEYAAERGGVKPRPTRPAPTAGDRRALANSSRSALRPQPMTVAITWRPARSQVATRQYPALSVNPVFIPFTPRTRPTRRLVLSNWVRLPSSRGSR